MDGARVSCHFRPESASPAQAWCLDPHDLIISKLAAARHKDVIFAEALLNANLVSKSILEDRAKEMPDEFSGQRRWVMDWIKRR